MATTGATAEAAHTNVSVNAFRILDLPPELIEIVCEHLDNESLLLVRHVCRALRTHSICAFGTRFFQYLVVVLHPISLAILLEIANHSALSKFVRNIAISRESLEVPSYVSSQGFYDLVFDLQTSMKNSGMDRLILTEVFQNIDGMQGVRIDDESFYDLNYQVHNRIDSVRCGRNRIIENVGGLANATKLVRGDPNYAFNVIFTSLQSAGVHERVKVSLYVAMDKHAGLFDLTSEDWQSNVAARVEMIKLVPYAVSNWTSNLLYSTPNLQELVVHGWLNIFQFSHPTYGLFAWPDIRSLSLLFCELDTPTFVEFLRAHQLTLTSLYMKHVAVTTGTWQEPLRAIESMGKLENLGLELLLEKSDMCDVQESVDLFQNYMSPNPYGIALSNHASICIAVHTILSDFRTIAWVHSPFKSAVDFKLAQAVIEGEAELHEGEWRINAQDGVFWHDGSSSVLDF